MTNGLHNINIKSRSRGGRGIAECEKPFNVYMRHKVFKTWLDFIWLKRLKIGPE